MVFLCFIAEVRQKESALSGCTKDYEGAADSASRDCIFERLFGNKKNIDITKSFLCAISDLSWVICHTPMYFTGRQMILFLTSPVTIFMCFNFCPDFGKYRLFFLISKTFISASHMLVYLTFMDAKQTSILRRNFGQNFR